MVAGWWTPLSTEGLMDGCQFFSWCVPSGHWALLHGALWVFFGAHAHCSSVPISQGNILLPYLAQPLVKLWILRYRWGNINKVFGMKIMQVIVAEMTDVRCQIYLHFLTLSDRVLNKLHIFAVVWHTVQQQMSMRSVINASTYLTDVQDLQTIHI